MRKEAVSLLGLTAAIASLPFPFLSVKANRVAEGVRHSLWELPPVISLLVLAVLAISLLLVLTPRVRGRWDIRILSSVALLALSFTVLIFGSNALVSAEGARSGPAAGFWLLAGGAYVLFYDATRRSGSSRALRGLYSLAAALPVVLILVFGPSHVLGIVQEYSNRQSRFWAELGSHLALSGIGVLGSTAIGVPLGMLAFRRKRAEKPVFTVSNGLQTIPSLALFGLLIAPLAFLSRQFPVLRSIGIRGVGNTPAVIALILYGLLPVVRNTFVGLKSIDRGIIDAGRGMGMDKRQLLYFVQVPISMPIVLTGVRITAVQTIGNAAVAALIGARGLGNFVFQGLGQAAPDLIVLGAIPIVFLAVIVDRAMDALIRGVSPKDRRKS